MALSRNATLQNSGWQNQGHRLSSTHGVLGVAVIMLADRARRRPSSQGTTNSTEIAGLAAEDASPANRLTTELEQAHAEIAALERQLKRKATLVGQLQKEVVSWHDQATIAESKVVDFQKELNGAHAAVSFEQNANRSLQLSLDLLLSDNSRQSQCLVEREAALADTQRELAFFEAQLVAMETERAQLLAAARETNELHQVEIDNLKGRLAAMSSSAIVAEQLLVSVRRSTAEKLTLIQDAVGAKDHRVQKLEHSLAQLINGANTLLVTFQAHDAALIRADEKMVYLAERVSYFEVDAKVCNAPADNGDADCESIRRNALVEVGADNAALDHSVLLKSTGHVERGPKSLLLPV